MPPLNIAIYYYYHEAIGQVEYSLRGSIKSRYSIGDSMCNNNFIMINKNTGIVSLIILSVIITYGNCIVITVTVRSIFHAST